MELVAGNYRLDGSLLLKTYRTGLVAAAGHDLVLEAASWSGSVDVPASGAEHATVTVSVRLADLRVREGRGGVKPLSDGDRREITGHMRRLLRVEEQPTATWRSTGRPRGDDRSLIPGELSLAGAVAPVAVRLLTAGEGRVTGKASVLQSALGITPYSSFFGALRLRDEVEVEFDATWSPRA